MAPAVRGTQRRAKNRDKPNLTWPQRGMAGAAKGGKSPMVDCRQNKNQETGRVGSGYAEMVLEKIWEELHDNIGIWKIVRQVSHRQRLPPKVAVLRSF
jgi:hypothetical protein